MAESDDDDRSPGRRIKVLRVVDKYGLDGMGDELERCWTAPGDERTSLRDLAERFNEELLAEALAEAGLQPLSGEVENTYRLLTDEDVNSADRTQAERRLERDGVAVEDLRSDFVTYQAVRTFLRDHRGAEYTGDDRDRVAVEAENIRRLRGRTETVVESKLDGLRRTAGFELGEFALFVDMNVLCEDCGRQYGIDELLERGGCECSTST